MTECPDRFRLVQFLRSTVTQAQTDAVGLLRTHALLDCERAGLERVKRLRPRLAAMHICAVGEMETVGEVHGNKILKHPGTERPK